MAPPVFTPLAGMEPEAIRNEYFRLRTFINESPKVIKGHAHDDRRMASLLVFFSTAMERDIDKKQDELHKLEATQVRLTDLKRMLTRNESEVTEEMEKVLWKETPTLCTTELKMTDVHFEVFGVMEQPKLDNMMNAAENMKCIENLRHMYQKATKMCAFFSTAREELENNERDATLPSKLSQETSGSKAIDILVSNMHKYTSEVYEHAEPASSDAKFVISMVDTEQQSDQAVDERQTREKIRAIAQSIDLKCHSLANLCKKWQSSPAADKTEEQIIDASKIFTTKLYVCESILEKGCKDIQDSIFQVKKQQLHRRTNSIEKLAVTVKAELGDMSRLKESGNNQLYAMNRIRALAGELANRNLPIDDDPDSKYTIDTSDEGPPKWFEQDLMEFDKITGPPA